jgi:hypothetical protein
MTRSTQVSCTHEPCDGSEESLHHVVSLQWIESEAISTQIGKSKNTLRTLLLTVVFDRHEIMALSSSPCFFENVGGSINRSLPDSAP